ncbi:MAG: FtsX-like permease family protein [Paracoccaceae bacterium]|nr:FtsX-like permease family protein [Paracoccaceae bacterium]MDG1736525.1 FtsX-like permease family protein [Paracoccaceae bacterium]MDG2259009.1 FtsX-like permease family protein [Paracoccaceae bacterium]
MIVSLAWRNIWRQPTRTWLSLIGMAFTSMLLVFVLSFQLGSYDTMKASMLQISDGFGQFQPEGYKDDPEMGKVIADPNALIADLRAVEGLSGVTARGNGFGLLANDERTFAAAVMGIDPANEGQVTTLTGKVTTGRTLSADDTNAIVLGDGLARNLKVGRGDPVTMLGSGTDGSVAADVLMVVGIFKSGVPELDRQIAQIPLERFKETFLMDGAAHAILIRSLELPAVEKAEAELVALADKHGVVYLNWQELRPEVQQMINIDFYTAVMMYATLVVVVVFIILNTLYMSVLERTREFGVLMAVGMKPRQIGRMVWMEMIFLTAVGAGIGIVFGVGLTGYFESVGIAIEMEGTEEIYAQWGLPSRFFPEMTVGRVLAGPAAMVGMIAVLGFIPYRRVMSLKPVKAMAG